MLKHNVRACQTVAKTIAPRLVAVDFSTRQATYFLKHLFVKNQDALNSLATELRLQLEALDSERNGYHGSLE